MTGHNSSSNDIWDRFSKKPHFVSSKPAVSTPECEISFDSLSAASGVLCGKLVAAGLRDGDLVALAIPNSSSFVPAFLALCRLSAKIALVSPQYRDFELSCVTKNLAPRAFLTTVSQAALLGVKVNPRDSMEITFHPSCEPLCLLRLGEDSEDQGLSGVGMDDIDLIKFSGGSTGEPKAIGLTAENVLAEAANVVADLALTPQDKIYASVPMFHSYGFDLGVLAALFSGASLILRDSFFPRKALYEISEREATIFLGVPSMYRLFLETQISGPPDLSRVRYFLSCTAPLGPDPIIEFYSRFGHPICQHYGSSETGAAATHHPAKVMKHIKSVGRPLKNVELKIIGLDGEILPPGVEGEVVIAGQAVARRYLMGAPPGRRNLDKGSFRTGDLGLLDTDGFLYLRGRVDNVINVGGFKVSPYQVERVLESHPAVREAVAVGVKDAIGETMVCAVVSLKAPASEAGIIEFCRVRLAEYEVPRRIEIREQVPRAPSGKVRLRSEDIKI